MPRRRARARASGSSNSVCAPRAKSTSLGAGQLDAAVRFPAGNFSEAAPSVGEAIARALAFVLARRRKSTARRTAWLGKTIFFGRALIAALHGALGNERQA